MDKKLKETIERAEKIRHEKAQRCVIMAAEEAITQAKKEKERNAEILKIANKWIDANLYTMIENAIVDGHDFIHIDRLEWPKGLSYSISCKVLTDIINNIGGLNATFTPAEKMVNYPTFDLITVRWG